MDIGVCLIRGNKMGKGLGMLEMLKGLGGLEMLNG